MRRQGGGPQGGRRPHGRQDRRTQAERTHQERGPGPQGGGQPLPVRSPGDAVAPGRAQDRRRQGQGHDRLGRCRAQAGSRDPHADAVEQHGVDRHIEHGPGSGHYEGRPGVQQAAQGPGGRVDHEHAGDAGGGGAQVGGRGLGHLPVRVQGGHDPGGCQGQERARHDANEPGQPHAVDPGPQGGRTPSRPEQPGGGGRGCVGQEDEQAHDGGQDRRGQGQARQRGGAQVAHHGRVNEDEERLGHQRAQGGQGQGEDLPVQAGCAGRRGRGRCGSVGRRGPVGRRGCRGLVGRRGR